MTCKYCGSTNVKVQPVAEAKKTRMFSLMCLVYNWLVYLRAYLDNSAFNEKR